MKKQFLIAVISLISSCVFSTLHALPERGSLQLRIDSPYFSPNDDGLQDQLFFQPVVQSKAVVNRWTVDILKAKNKKRVARLSGNGFPALIKWDGGDKKGVKVENGAYVAKMKAFTKPALFSEQLFWIDTQPPVVSIALSTNVFNRSFLEKGQMVFHPDIQDDSPIEKWLLQVIDSEGRTAYVYWSSGPVHNVSWNGTNQSTKVLVPQGDYRIILQAWDLAGNVSEPAYADLKANVTAREMLEHSLSHIRVNETPIGLIVQLEPKVIFQMKKRRIVLSPAGIDLLREVAILVNAYPDAPVKLDGYSRVMKSASQDRDQASVYAWRVYSYLTKVGNVKPSRMNVRGRGRSPMFDRRSVGVPLMKNGIEVVIEGSGPW